MANVEEALNQSHQEDEKPIQNKKQTQSSSKSVPKDKKSSKKDKSRNRSDSKQKPVGFTDESSIAASVEVESRGSNRVSRRGVIHRESMSESASTTKGDKETKKKKSKSKKSKKDKKRKKSGKKSKKGKKRRFHSDSDSSNSSSDSSDSSEWSLNDKEDDYGPPETISNGSDNWVGRS